MGFVSTDRKRRRMIEQIKRTRLGGVDRITLDAMDDEAPRRYAQVYSNGFGVNLVFAGDPFVRHELYGDEWTLDGVIDLDTGDLVPEPEEAM